MSRKAVFASVGVFALATMLVGCDNNSPYTAMDYGKQRIASLMKDPDSAKFDSVTFHQISNEGDNSFVGYVCGNVNAKNSFGAYSGNQRFIVKTEIRNSGKTISTSDVVLDDGQTSDFQALVDKRCK
ncbi:hypothetical protein EGU82_18550 [Salmonella enterica subsp. enterica serovar Uganda]|nr:hypothetical protein [Salmonella enterica subsp. enterica serovar Uganda]EEI9214289.1 hypothetical protein [Salmonella enterica subsp. enterica serovar Carrau]EJJ0396531.1 hypothetical protein [Salmonella enterica]EJJ4034840.1 hypothetical protein [Salmonella enterica]EJJ4049173.1 hypothetical protein [Salmonella enterica]